MSTLFPGPVDHRSLSLRCYQSDAIEAAYRHLRERQDNPCIVLPTGAGKTPVMASICHDAVKRWGGRVLVLSHVKELIQQTAETLGDWFPDLNVGVYSAGLNRRDTRSDVLIAGIQSVHDKGLKLAGSRPFNLVLIDEAHRIPTAGDGMYCGLLTDLQIASPSIRVIGLTATPYRLKGGYVCGPDHFLNQICHETGVRELIAKGYLCPLISKQSKHAVDSSQLGIRNGEFKTEDLAAAFGEQSVVDVACAEIAALTGDRKSVLLFCCDVEHADHVSTAIANLTDTPCGLITGQTPAGERDRTINAFKDGRLKYLANVNVLTEGFDARQVDCVCLMRSTLSPGLYYQMVGRGLRTHEAKSDCLVLDFGGNVLRHGCIDAIKIKGPKSAGDDSVPSRVCPECDEIVGIAYAICPQCGFEFPAPVQRGPNHEERASDAPITSDQIKAVTYEITDVGYSEHEKRGAEPDDPRTMRVTYYEGMSAIADEWVCVEHSGFAGEKAANWWAQRCNLPMPDSAAEAARLGSLGYLAEPKSIDVVRPPGEKFKRIVRYVMGPIPAAESIETAVDEWGDEVRVERSDQDYSDEDIPF
ncbi:MAG: DEAD/DEAH box helicase family protein [Planctomycetaceae bacterium]